MFVEVKLYDIDSNLVRERSFVRKNKASLTRKVNDLKRFISGPGFERYGPLQCVVYVNDSHYCDIYYDPDVFGKAVVFHECFGSL